MQREPEAPDVYSQLAMAYGRKGDLAEADLASAQAALARGDMKTARELAARAKTRFPDRLARLGQGRRHRRTEGSRSPACSAAPMFTFGPAQIAGRPATGPTE